MCELLLGLNWRRHAAGEIIFGARNIVPRSPEKLVDRTQVGLVTDVPLHLFRRGGKEGGRRRKNPERDKVRNLIMIGNLGQRRHSEWARKGGRFQYG